MVAFKLHQAVYGGQPGDTVDVDEPRARLGEQEGYGKRVAQVEGESPAKVSMGHGKTPNAAAAVGRLDETWTIPSDERPESLPAPEQKGTATAPPAEPETDPEA